MGTYIPSTHLSLIGKAGIFLCFLLGNIGMSKAQVVQLMVSTSKNEAVSNASVYVNQTLLGTTDSNGLLSADFTAYSMINLAVTAKGFDVYEEKIIRENISDSLLLVLIEEASQSLDELVITAGRKAENIATIPSSVTILNEKDLQTQLEMTTNLSTILGNTIPGLGTATGRATNAGQTLRGRQVLVLVDGIPQSTPLMNGSRDIRTIDPNAIERVEVIKGATSIYGNGSGGGIINYITKKYKGDKALEGKTSVGTSFNAMNPSGTLGYRVSQFFSGKKNKLSYNVGGSIDYTGLLRDGDGTPLGQNDGLSNTNQHNAFVKFTYDINEKEEVSAFYNFYGSLQHSKYISKNGVYGQTPTVGVRGEDLGKPAGTPYNHNAMMRYVHRGIFLNSDMDVTAYYTTFRSMNRYITKGTAWYGAGQTQINSEKKGLRINLNTPFNIKSISGEVTYGLDMLNDVTNQDLTDGRVYIPNMNMWNVAPYAQLKVDVLPNLIFKGGIRYENANVQVNDYQTIAIGPNNEGSIPVKGGRIPYQATMFNAGLRFNKYEVFNPFISFSQAFSINEIGRILRRAEENTIKSLSTDPIITNNYEIGFSSRFAIFNVTAAYYFSASNLGMNLVDRNGFLFPQREPEEVQGFEIAADARISPKITLNVSYAYVEGKVKFDDGRKAYLNGSRIAPPKATASIAYRPNDKLGIQLFWVFSGVRDRFNLNDKGKYNNSEGPVKEISVFNVSANYSINTHWGVSLGIENLFNKTYYPVVSQYRALDAEYLRAPGNVTTMNVYYKF